MLLHLLGLLSSHFSSWSAQVMLVDGGYQRTGSLCIGSNQALCGGGGGLLDLFDGGHCVRRGDLIKEKSRL